MACFQISERHAPSLVLRHGVVLCSAEIVVTLGTVAVVAAPLPKSSRNGKVYEWYHGCVRIKTLNCSSSVRLVVVE